MNNRNLWTVLGLGALSIALLALPGASAKKQETGSTSQKHTQIYVNRDKDDPGSGIGPMSSRSKDFPPMTTSRFCWAEVEAGSAWA